MKLGHFSISTVIIIKMQIRKEVLFCLNVIILCLIALTVFIEDSFYFYSLSHSSIVLIIIHCISVLNVFKFMPLGPVSICK